MWASFVDPELTAIVCSKLRAAIMDYDDFLQNGSKSDCKETEKEHVNTINNILLTYAQLIKVEKYRYFVYGKSLHDEPSSYDQYFSLRKIRKALVEDLKEGKKIGTRRIPLRMDLLVLLPYFHGEFKNIVDGRRRCIKKFNAYIGTRRGTLYGGEAPPSSLKECIQELEDQKKLTEMMVSEDYGLMQDYLTEIDELKEKLKEAKEETKAAKEEAKDQENLTTIMVKEDYGLMQDYLTEIDELKEKLKEAKEETKAAKEEAKDQENLTTIMVKEDYALMQDYLTKIDTLKKSLEKCETKE